MDALTSTPSIVRGSSETGLSDVALRNHLGPSGSRTSRPRSASSRGSHQLIDARRSAVPHAVRVRRNEFESLSGSSRVQSQVCVSRSNDIHGIVFPGTSTTTSQSPGAAAGSTRSPMRVPRLCMAPNQASEGAFVGGMISATGLPKRVIRTGCPVLPTRSRTAKQVALNFEICISSIIESYHGSRPWFIPLVIKACRIMRTG